MNYTIEIIKRDAFLAVRQADDESDDDFEKRLQDAKGKAFLSAIVKDCDQNKIIRLESPFFQDNPAQILRQIELTLAHIGRRISDHEALKFNPKLA